jgi:transcriptional regulator with XRE-family HTH domain
VSTETKRVKQAMAAVLEELRKQRDLTQEQLALRAGIPYGTLRNMARGDVDVKIPDLVAIAAALSTTPLPGGGPAPVTITASDMVNMAVERAGGFDELVSEAAARVDVLRARRLQKEAEKMSAAEIERRAEAALRDKQMEQQPDESETP